MKYSFLLSCIGIALSLNAAEFEPGGVTFDFKKISEERFQQKKSNAKNLFGEWKEAPAWVHMAGQEAVELRKKILPFVKFKKEQTKDGILLNTQKSIEIEKAIGQKCMNVSGSWMQKVGLPDAAGGRYQIQLKYQAKRFGKFNSAGYIIAVYHDAAGKSLSTAVKPYPLGGGDWQTFTTDFDLPSGTAAITFYLRLDGCGEITYLQPELTKAAVDFPATLILAPAALLDHTFALSQNDPAILTFAWRRDIPKAQWKLNAPVLNLQLPKEVRLKAAASTLSILGCENGHWRISLESLRHRLNRIDGFDAYLLLAVMAETDAAPGTKLARASYWLSDGEKQLSAKGSFDFIVMKQIPEAKKSSLYLNGIYPGGLYMDFKEREIREDLARFIGRTGSRWLVANPDAEMTKLYRKNGMEIITPELYWVANGYRVGDPKNKPDDAKYKILGKTSDMNIINGTCPTAIYRKTDYFKNNIMPYLEKNLKGMDGLIANWEPFMFHGMGCFCDNCRDEFAIYAKLSSDEAKKAWPQELLINRKYHALGTRFRSWQHARMVKTIQEAVTKFTTGKAGFIPEVAWIQMIDCDERLSAAGEHDPLDYAGSLRYIDPWGPYAVWKSLEPYTYVKGLNLDTYIAAKGVVDYTRRNFPAPNRPKLLALPHGMQCDFWVTQPEAIGMEVLGFFVAGYNASTVYLFPKGYDNRFWAVQSEVNTLIAENEEMVCGGKAYSDISVEPLSPFPAPKKRINAKYFNDQITASLLQAAAFSKGNRILVAVGNYWENGEVFFRLNVGGLNPDQRYVIQETARKRIFADSAKSFFTGREIASGIKLHTGAMRWAFFTIAPYDEKAEYGRAIRPIQWEKERKERENILNAAAEKEALRDRAEDREFRKSELRSMKSGMLECHPRKAKDGSQILEFTSGKNALSLTLNGMAVQNWSVNGVELLAGTRTSGFGAPAFWRPPLQIEQPFLVKDQTAIPGGLRITAERSLNKKNSPALEFLKIRQTLDVSESLEKITIRTVLINGNDSETGMASVTLGFRYHILPLCLGKGGALELFAENGTPLAFRRKQERMVFALGTSDSAHAMKQLFQAPGNPVLIGSNLVYWRNAGVPFQVKMTTEPAKQLAGFACWDTPNLVAPTFEPFYHPVTIPAEKSVEYSISLTVEQNRK